jgi:hypothetical protein
VRVSESAAPLAAVLLALGAFACCVPLGLAGALGVLALSAMFDSLRPWFLGGASLLLAAGIWQTYRTGRTCRRRASKFSLAVLGLSAFVVLGVLLFPQMVAQWIADGFL